MNRIKTGLIGSPLKKSLSPRLFEIFSALTPAEFSYSLLEIPRAEDLPANMERIKTLDWSGFNVTLPLKETIIPLLDSLSREASAIGAVNAVTIKKGKLKGYNTDAFAVETALKEAGCRPRGKTCVIWGAGGAARAAAWVLARAGAREIAVRNRSRARCAAFVKYFADAFPGTTFTAGGLSSVPENAALFVNATPLGMYAPLPKALRSGGPAGSCYLDFTYDPRIRRASTTPFLKNRSGVAIPGIDLLIYQALKSAELFGAAPVPPNKIRPLKDLIKARL